jgi:microcompartment protein CcmL/EutN
MRARERTPQPIEEPCLGLVELSSIARGLEAADQILKTAHCRLVLARAVTPGKYLVLFDGSVEDVTSALTRVRDQFAAELIDDLFLPSADPRVVDAIEGRPSGASVEALGVIETRTVAAAITAADAAVKKSRVELLELHLAVGIGGKGYFTLTGAVADVEAALQIAQEVARERDREVATVLIPRPHPELGRIVG